MPIYGIVAQDNAVATAGPSAPLNTKFIVVGWDTWNFDPLVLVSDDGTTWQYRNPGVEFSSDNLYGVAHDPISERWVAVGVGGVSNIGVVYYSDDKGDTWTLVDPGMGASSRLFGVCWTGTRFIAVGRYSSLPAVIVSTDGISWTAKTPDPNTAGHWDRVIGASTLAIAVGVNAAASAARIMTSTNDGDSWTSRTPSLGTSAFPQDVAIDEHTAGLVAVTVARGGASGATRVVSSTNGTTWTARTSAPSTGVYWNGIVWNGIKFIAVGADASTGSIPSPMTSSDGTTWIAKTPAPTTDFFPLAVGAATSDGAIVAVGTDAAFNDPRMMFSSDDGNTWTQVFPPSIEIEPGNPGALWMNLQHVAGA